MAHSTPHDAFVKAIFSHPARAADAVRRLERMLDHLEAALAAGEVDAVVQALHYLQ